MAKTISKKIISIMLIVSLLLSMTFLANPQDYFSFADTKELSKAEILEWGKDPSLGLRKLHEQGYTGKGVNLAFIGQPIGDTNHDDLRHIDMHYDESVAVAHGCGEGSADTPGRRNISILSGKNAGIAPEATVYYVGNATARKDQNTDAEALRRIIEINKTLPKSKKFKVVGLSNYWQELNPKKTGYKALKAAVAEAEAAGIEVLFESDFFWASIKEKGMDRNLIDSWIFSDDMLCAPDGITVADCNFGYRNDSFCNPMASVTAILALGTQIAPEFSGKKLMSILKATAYKYDSSSKGGLINPKGFIEEVERAKKEGSSYSVKNAKKYIAYDIVELMEWGKNPGLGIRELQSEGYTGKNAVVAYIDQPLGSQLHEELKDINLVYNTDVLTKYGKSKNASMHGPSVLSLIAGKTIGVAPKAKVYYYAVPENSFDHKHEAEAIRMMIKKNKTLSKGKKIKVFGISDNIAIDPAKRKKNPQELRDAMAEAKKAGILVTLCGEYGGLKCEEMKNPDDYRNYTKNGTAEKDSMLFVPNYRTTARFSAGYEQPVPYSLSWASPYVVGLVALGLQVNPDLTATKLISLMKSTAHHFSGQTTGGIVNPRAYLNAVEKTVKTGKVKNYQLYLYNSEKLTPAELKLIKAHAAKTNEQLRVRYLDTAGMKFALEVYEAMKNLQQQYTGKIVGVQIFGTAEDVPAFNINNKVQMGNGIHEGVPYLSDYFYSNLNNEIDALDGISIYQVFHEKNAVDFFPQCPVVRLPLTSGDYAQYFKKYYAYEKKVKGKTANRLQCFTSPTFAAEQQLDDLGWFVKNRMDKKYKFIKSSKYGLYGNLKGDYPVTTTVKGDFTAKNFKKENAVGVTDFLIESHGQADNFDRCTFKDGVEQRESILNTRNINDVLGKNYYNLFAVSCSAAEGLNTKNIVYHALKGKGIHLFGATSELSMNGMNVKADLAKMKNCNFSYFYYTYFRQHYKLGKDITESFYQGQKLYAKEILGRSSHIQADANYQFNLQNLLVYEHFGLL